MLTNMNVCIYIEYEDKIRRYSAAKWTDSHWGIACGSEKLGISYYAVLRLSDSHKDSSEMEPIN